MQTQRHALCPQQDDNEKARLPESQATQADMLFSADDMKNSHA
jgi:hypothetical protein